MKVLKGSVEKMEGGSTMSKQARGRNNLKKENWQGKDYMNDNNLNKYGQAKLHPYYKFLPVGWNKYSGENPRTLCGNVLKLVEIPDGKEKDGKNIDMRSNNRRSCCKQYMRELV